MNHIQRGVLSADIIMCKSIISKKLAEVARINIEIEELKQRANNAEQALKEGGDNE